jgi:N-acetylglucosamine-6-phosphate deacetylase
MMTLAPELDNAPACIRLLVGDGVLAAIGHTDAGYETTVRAIEAGATVATHLFNAMPGLHHRQPGPITALLRDRRVTVELINDGVHLHPAVIDLVLGVTGPARVAFVTDAMGAAGAGDGHYLLGPLQVTVEGGVARLADCGAIAGSTLTLDVALRRAVQVNGLPLEQAVQALSTNPARLLGLADRVGSLEAGKDADLVVLDNDSLRLVAVMRRGQWVTGGSRVTSTPSPVVRHAVPGMG